MEDFLKDLIYPVMIISSRAGEGNFSVGRAIFDILSSNRKGEIFHFTVEELISYNLYKKHFLRYKYICFNFHWLLYFIYFFPINYIWNYLKEKIFKNTNLDKLLKSILKLNAKTVICTNHRACFWSSILKKRGLANFFLVGVITDYNFNPGWRFIFWDKVNLLFGPIEKKELPNKLYKKYIKIELPLKKDFYMLNNKMASKNNILISGGGWGLGPIYKVALLLSKEIPDLNLFILCGDNENLYNKLKENFFSNEKIKIYLNLDSISSLLEKCASIITKPGAIILTEAFVAKRKIFLIDGLATEQKNAHYAIKNFNATKFSLKNFINWYKTTI